MIHLLLVIAIIFCAYKMMGAEKLLIAILWLALCSVLVSVLLYKLGAPEVAVIELSVGAGLVTVLFVYAFSIIGELTVDEIGIVPRPLVWTLILVTCLTLGWLTIPHLEASAAISEAPFAATLWQMRGLDVIVQIVLIFSGIIGLMGLLAYSKKAPTAESPAAQPEAKLEENRD
jgi:uncharacterized MnhB-related membrane protein